MGIAFDEAGNFYVVNHGSNSVLKFSPKGENLGVFINTGLNKPAYIVIQPAAKPAKPVVSSPSPGEKSP
jgi:DNA-binding beta-propeller fold protein YncE